MNGLPPSPFLTLAASDAVAESAGASNLPPAIDAPVEVNSVLQGGAARIARDAHNVEAVGSNPTPATSSDSVDCIGEIFHHARKLLAEDDRRAEDFVDWNAFETALEEPLPLFIRDGDQLKRRAA